MDLEEEWCLKTEERFWAGEEVKTEKDCVFKLFLARLFSPVFWGKAVFFYGFYANQWNAQKRFGFEKKQRFPGDF